MGHKLEGFSDEALESMMKRTIHQYPDGALTGDRLTATAIRRLVDTIPSTWGFQLEGFEKKEIQGHPGVYDFLICGKISLPSGVGRLCLPLTTIKLENVGGTVGAIQVIRAF